MTVDDDQQAKPAARLKAAIASENANPKPASRLATKHVDLKTMADVEELLTDEADE